MRPKLLGNTKMKLLALILGVAGVHCRPQVTSEIFSDTDLLAIDSGARAAVVAAPPGFGTGIGGGGVVRAPNQAVGLASGNPELRSYQNVMRPDGSYSFGYETQDGTTREETGEMTGSGYSVSGSWSYLGPDGIVRTVVFTADQNGFRPRILKASDDAGAGRTGRNLSISSRPSRKNRPQANRRRPVQSRRRPLRVQQRRPAFARY